MKPKLLYFADCYIYGGSDRNIINIMNYMAEHSDSEVYFAYRYFKTYQMGVDRDLSTKVKAIPLSLLSNDTLFHRLNQWVNNRLLKKVIKLPFWLVQKTGLYAVYDYLILRKTISRIKPDLIHVNNGGYPASLACQTAIFAANIPGKKNRLSH